MSRLVYALDVGGTKIAAALVDDQGAVHAGLRRPTDAHLGGAHVLQEIGACIAALGVHAGDRTVTGIGISSAGVIDRTGVRVLDATDAMPGWAGTELGAVLGERFGLPVAAANDVHCALLGELWRNPALDGRQGCIAMLALGTGIGGALAFDGRLHAGRNGLAGHLGRTLAWDGGGWAPLDALASGTALARLYRGAAPAPDGAAVMALAAAGEPAASEALARWLDHLALALHNLYWSLDPELVLLGGGVVDSRALWWDGLLARLDARGAPLRIAAALLGGQAGLLGAAHLALAPQGDAR